MRDTDSNTNAALQKRNLIERDLVWITAQEFSSGDPVSAGFWTGEVPSTFTVLAGLTLTPTSRSRWTIYR